MRRWEIGHESEPVVSGRKDSFLAGCENPMKKEFIVIFYYNLRVPSRLTFEPWILSAPVLIIRSTLPGGFKTPSVSENC
jgi:hypothetical protein